MNDVGKPESITELAQRLAALADELDRFGPEDRRCTTAEEFHAWMRAHDDFMDAANPAAVMRLCVAVRQMAEALFADVDGSQACRGCFWFTPGLSVTHEQWSAQRWSSATPLGRCLVLDALAALGQEAQA